MDVLDVFSRTFYPLAAQTGIPMRTLRRHLQVYRRYTDGDDSTMLVSRELSSSARMCSEP